MYWENATVINEAAVPTILRMLSFTRRTAATTKPVPAVRMTKRRSTESAPDWSMMVVFRDVVLCWTRATRGQEAMAKKRPKA